MKYITTFLMLLTLLLTGCSSDKTYSLFTTFEEKLMTQDYKGLYTLLSSESQQSMTEDEFINRYSTIYSGIGANNIELKMFEIDKENETIPFSLKMETVAGELWCRGCAGSGAARSASPRAAWRRGWTAARRAAACCGRITSARASATRCCWPPDMRRG